MAWIFWFQISPRARCTFSASGTCLPCFVVIELYQTVMSFNVLIQFLLGDHVEINTLPTIYVSDYWSILSSCCFSGLTLGYHAIKTYITIYNREQTLYYFLLSCSFRMIPQTYLSRLCCLSDIFILSFTDVVCAQVFLSFGVFFLFVCWHNTHMDTAQ